MRVLVTGASGMLGSALLPCLGREQEFVGVDSKDFDISPQAAIQRAFWDAQPELLFHLAACTDVDGCEVNPALAREVNTHGTRNGARSCAEISPVLLYVSTEKLAQMMQVQSKVMG